MKNIKLITIFILLAFIGSTGCSSHNAMNRAIKEYYSSQGEFGMKMSRDIVSAMKRNIKLYNNCFINGYGGTDDSCKVWALYSHDGKNYIGIQNFKNGRQSEDYAVEYSGNIDWIKNIRDVEISNYVMNTMAALDGNNRGFFYRHPYDKNEIAEIGLLPLYWHIKEINIDTISNDFVRQYAIALTRYVFPDK